MIVLERAKGWPADRMSKILPVFKGMTVACIATGPSLTPEQVEAVRAAGIPALVCNDSYLIAPFADVCYFADQKFWNWKKDTPEWLAFKGQKCTIQSSAFQVKDPDVHVLKNSGHEGLSTDPGGVMTGSHSGYQLVNIATLSGAKRVLLLGYDCQRVKGKKHWFGEHPDSTEPPYTAIRTRYNPMAAAAKAMGVEIINCTPGSAIDAFPKEELARVLRDTPCPVLSA